MNCIVLADQPTKGIKSKGWNGLIPVNKKHNLIQNQINVIRSHFPKSKIIYIYGFDHRKVECYFSRTSVEVSNFVYLRNNKFIESGDGYAVSMTHEFLDKECLFFYGGMVLQPSMFKNFEKNKSQIYTSNKDYNELGCVVNQEGNVEHVCYGLENYVGELYYVSKKDIDNFRAIATNHDYRNYFLFEMINKAIESGSKFKEVNINRKNTFKTVLQQK